MRPAGNDAEAKHSHCHYFAILLFLIAGVGFPLLSLCLYQSCLFRALYRALYPLFHDHVRPSD
ncbi:hypothetical protein K458DRAFT_419691 [Lentithecium fluviatile CBS 122367]|uniref:Uncharacterized protein n=1 Tax=Lentithecium fluviatile CBS 122367 TaxID=1168545 RepID=A0A6G1IX73_9PLEO|nr:hypothetical protein K458DRAFT_419691 [Lentithecium fluviatile CBS 122367]